MRFAKILFLLCGLALLGLLLARAETAVVLTKARQIGWTGLLVVLALYAVNYVMDVWSWQLTLPRAGRGWRWTARLYGIRMIGEVYNNITPMASIGGEPIKAWLLKRNHGIGWRESGASLVLAKTTSVISLFCFVSIGFLFVMARDDLSATHKSLAATSLLLLAFCMVVFVLMQRWKLSTFTATWLGRTRFGARLSRGLSALQDLDLIFARYYDAHRRQLVLSTLAALVNWAVGVFEVWLVCQLIGHPIGWSDAWIIESMTQLVRTATFFIPAAIGSQEGAFALTAGTLTGVAGLGLSIALVRRARELAWTALGLGLASLWSVSRADANAALDSRDSAAS